MSWKALSDLVRIDLHEGDDSVMVRLAGELDLVSSPHLLELIEEVGRQRPRVILDLCRVSFVDASGLSQLLLGDRRLRELGGELVLRRPHRAVRRLLELCGCEVALSVEEAPVWLEPTPDVLAVCGEAIEAAIGVGRGTMGNVQLADSTGALRIAVERGFFRPFLEFFEVVDDTESACGAASAKEEAVYVADVTRSLIFLGVPSLEVVRDAGVRSVASIPLRGPQGGVVGMLSVHSDRPGEWTADQRRRLRGLADATSRLLGAEAS